MKLRSALSAVVTLPLLTIACGGSSSSPQPIMCNGANAVANEKNNYAFSSTFTLMPVTVKSSSNLSFDWGSLTTDFLMHPMSATADVNTVTVLIFGPGIPLSDLAQKLNSDELTPQDVFVVPPPSIMPSGGATTAMLYDFTLNGAAQTPDTFNSFFDPSKLDPSSYSYMAAAASGTEIGKNFRMLQTLKLDPTSSNTMVKLTNDSTKLSYNANLHGLTITGVPANTAAITIDFSDMVNRMAKNALGATFKDGYITNAVVGHYTQTPEELEKRFLDLNMIATSYYTGQLTSSTMVDLSTLTEQTTGANFPGIDDTGTWLVGLLCGNCQNPAPWYMTIIKPCTM
jgi:hypothetical protein